MIRSRARSSSDEAVSSVVAMIMVLAVLAVAVPLTISNFVPYYVKSSEMQRYAEAEDSFFKIVEFYPSSGRLRLQLGEQTPFGFVAATSLKAESTGMVEVHAACDGGNVNLKCNISSLKLSMLGRAIPNRTLIFSEGGIAVEQAETRVVLSEPRIELNYSDSLTVAVDCLKDERGISGSGSAIVDIAISTERMEYENCTGWIYVNDSIFQDYWIKAMQSTGLFSGSTLSFSNLNLTLWVRWMDVRV